MSLPVTLTREPIINKKRAITANRIIVHGSSIPAVVETLNDLRDVWPVQNYPVLVSLGRLVPTLDLLEWQIPENTMLEIPMQTLEHVRTQSLLEELARRELSNNVCLAWYSPDADVPEGVEWRFVIMDARRHSGPHAAPGIALAWGVQDPSAFEQAIRAGYDGASGWFFLRSSAPAEELEPGPTQIIRLVNLISNHAELSEIENILKQDVALSYRLLRYLNSADLDLGCEIQSFRHAINILGYEDLHKWLSLLLVNASRDPSAPAMMQTAIARGRFMEEVGASRFPESERDNLFITGAFSLLDLLLGASMEAILGEMNLPPSVTDALLYDKGEYAPFLNLSRLCESFDSSSFLRAAQALGLSAEELSRAQLVALGFADRMQA